MLRYLGAADGVAAIIRATEQTIADGTTTHDLGGSWWKLVEAGGSWWKLVEAGGSWWKREHELDDGCDHRASEEVRSRV